MISGIYRPNYDVPKLVENVSKMSLLKDTPASALKKRHRIVTCSSKHPWFVFTYKLITRLEMCINIV